MVAKGKDASELFPAVVKNVVSKNLEVNDKTESSEFILIFNCFCCATFRCHMSTNYYNSGFWL